MPKASTQYIRLRGVRQNNLKGFNLDVPLGKLTVVTGLSGSGKSSLVFETLHAEGQRRYVETFSPYTRQFLEMLDKPAVDSVENIRPSIAIQQSNSVRTSRSTVGTMTELCDYFKVWFAHHARLHDPATGDIIEDDQPQNIWRRAKHDFAGREVLVGFSLSKPANFSWSEIFESLTAQGFTRLLVDGKMSRLDALNPQKLQDNICLLVITDRLRLAPANRTRFIEAATQSLHYGEGRMELWEANSAGSNGQMLAAYSSGLRSPVTGQHFRPASPALFSFNSPVGACPKCRGFGRVIEIDPKLVIPDQSLSIKGGAIRPFQGEVYRESLNDLLGCARRLRIPVNKPWHELTAEQQAMVWEGEPGYGENGREWPHAWYGIRGFFSWLEGKAYRMHVRVFLSKYRAYTTCPDCAGNRLIPESLNWKWQGHTLPDLYRMPVRDLLALLEHYNPTKTPSDDPAMTACPPELGAGGSFARGTEHRPASGATADSVRSPADLAGENILTRLHFLDAVGLHYLTLDRPSRTLSGGETQRVSLTSCLGASLTDTLFVLDEPSIGLHGRDLHRLVNMLRRLTGQGNTVVVVEHDESVIRAADHVIEIGPEPGIRGGHLVFQGTPKQMAAAKSKSLTGAYLCGARNLAPSTPPRDCRHSPTLAIRGARKHNLDGLDLDIPLGRLVCLAGVSGSGKSTLLDQVIHQGLLQKFGRIADNPASIDHLEVGAPLEDVIFVDQSPVTRTPRSNAAVYSGAWQDIRNLIAATESARAAGHSASSFSFNTGSGRCDHCQGLGYETVEMQFLADIHTPCPVCEGKRFKPEILAIEWRGKSVADMLAMEVAEAVVFFADSPKIANRFAQLASVGLSYLPLGQPLNSLSGGEAQRLKLVRFLGAAESGDKGSGSLLLLDEPTTGLHLEDIGRLLGVLQKLVDNGHSLIVIEHHPDIIRAADWVIELGPEAGADGGKVGFSGNPADLAKSSISATAPFIKREKSYNKKSTAIAFPQYAIAAEDFKKYGTGAPKRANCARLDIIGAREHNLKNLSLSIPHGKFNVITGVSGSGKSSLAFDIVFAEGQRRFMESMSAYARQFVEQLSKPDVDVLNGIAPTVAIEQRVTRGSRKSTVATITEVAQYLRLLYAKTGIQHSPASGHPVTAMSADTLAQRLRRTLAAAHKGKTVRMLLCAPLVRARKGHYEPLAKWAAGHGYSRLRIDGRLVDVAAFKKLDRYREHDIELVVEEFESSGKLNRTDDQKAIEALAEALRLGKGTCFLLDAGNDDKVWFSTSRTDPVTGEAFPELDPKHFSWNSAKGWCPTCRGYGHLYPWMADDENFILVESAHGEDGAPSSKNPGGISAKSNNRGRSAAMTAHRPPSNTTDGGRHSVLAAPSGINSFTEGEICPDCRGGRLNETSRWVYLMLDGKAADFLDADARRNRPARAPVDGLSMPELLQFTPASLLNILQHLKLDARGRRIANDILPQIEERLGFMDRVGLGYLSLARATTTLSGGEAQRIRLAAQLGSNLTGVLYVLDEPSIGLHARDNKHLIQSLKRLRDRGNTLLVVEHDDDTMRAADRILDLGPGAGIHGGELLAQGTFSQIMRNRRSLTGICLREGMAHPIRRDRRPPPPSDKSHSRRWLSLCKPTLRNLKGDRLHIPIGQLTVVCGVSGAGKSTLIRDLLKRAVETAIANNKRKLTGKNTAAWYGGAKGAVFQSLINGDSFRTVIEVDQEPIGKTPRSTPATYINAFDIIRDFFATLPEARIHGHGPGTFSFNTSGGRCEQCKGAGRIKLEMSFMPETYVPCEECGGGRYGPELADIRWKDRNIGDILQMSFEEAAAFFDFHPKLRALLELMVETGLGYLTLGQSSPTLSGGEAQRLKLVSELARGLPNLKKDSTEYNLTRQNLYILEEPTIGLHLSDCRRLIEVLHRLVDQGHTVIVIEHHLDLIAEADHLVEVGPNGGDAGGRILHQGPPESLLQNQESPTAPFLRDRLNA